MIAGASALTRKIVVPAMFAAAACSTHTPPKISPAFTRDLDAIFGAQLTEHALWGVEIKSLDTGRIWYSRNARTLLMPASNMKILTLAAAAQTLGWDYRFKTTLEAVGSIELGTLHGNLVVRGTGDPTINSRKRSVHVRSRAMRQPRATTFSATADARSGSARSPSGLSSARS